MNNNKLIKVLQYYPFITQIMYILGLIIIYEPLEPGNAFINMWRKSADLLVNLEIVSIYPIILFVFNIIMIMVVIRNAINMMESNVTSVEMIEIALTIVGVGLAIELLLVCFTMLILSGSIGCIGIRRLVKQKVISKGEGIVHYIFQFVFCMDIVNALALYYKYTKVNNTEKNNV